MRFCKNNFLFSALIILFSNHLSALPTIIDTNVSTTPITAQVTDGWTYDILPSNGYSPSHALSVCDGIAIDGNVFSTNGFNWSMINSPTTRTLQKLSTSNFNYDKNAASKFLVSGRNSFLVAGTNNIYYVSSDGYISDKLNFSFGGSYVANPIGFTGQPTAYGNGTFYIGDYFGGAISSWSLGVSQDSGYNATGTWVTGYKGAKTPRSIITVLNSALHYTPPSITYGSNCVLVGWNWNCQLVDSSGQLLQTKPPVILGGGGGDVHLENINQFDNGVFIGAEEVSSTYNSKTIKTYFSSEANTWSNNICTISTRNVGHFITIGSGHGYLMLGSGSEVWVSADRGLNWSQINGPWDKAKSVSFKALNSTYITSINNTNGTCQICSRVDNSAPPKPPTNSTPNQTFYIALNKYTLFNCYFAGSPTSYSASNLPSGLTINQTTGQISGTVSSKNYPGLTNYAQITAYKTQINLFGQNITTSQSFNLPIVITK
jgi:hypothetical protein